MTTKLVTPLGHLTYVYVGNPDPDYGDFKVTHHFDPNTDEGKAFLASVKKAYDAAVADARKEGKKVAPPPFKKSETFEGFVSFKSRTKFDPKVYDAQNKLVDAKTRLVFSGSTGRLAVTLDPFKNASQGVGLALRMASMQVVTWAEPPESAAPFAAVPAADDTANDFAPVQETPKRLPPDQGGTTTFEEDLEQFARDEHLMAPATTKTSEAQVPAQDDAWNF